MTNNELHRAFCVHGASNAHVARSMGISAESVSRYLHGHRLVPIRKREGLERALDTVIDWPTYEAEFNGTISPEKAEEAAQTGSTSLPPVETDRGPSQMRKRAPERLTTEEAHKELGLPSNGFWASVWGDDEGDFDAV